MPKRPKKSKEDKLIDSLLKVTRQLMMGRSFVPLSLQDLIDKLALPSQHRDALLKVLNILIKKGEVVLKKNRYSWQKTKNEIVTGTIRMHHRGFGFVVPDDSISYPEDIFIPKPLTHNSVDGDKVEVIINNESISEKGPEGRVINIVSRGRTHIAGIIKEVDRLGELIAYVPMLGQSQRVVVHPGKRKSLKPGDRLVMEIIEWGTKDTETLCRYSHYLGHISDHRCDIKASIEEYELRSEFPKSAIDEAQSYGKTVQQRDIKAREDLRDLECFTIDPDTAKDFDDALSLKKDRKGNFHLGVHIADVTHYVRPGSPLDSEARQRANSTYFPGYCLPMLPKELSNNLCSLKPNVNRLAVSVLMTLSKTGELLDYRITRSVIRSQKRYTYKEAMKILQDKKASPHSKTMKLMEKLCLLLKKKRFERGSLELAVPELAVIVDEEGLPESTEYIEYDITHQLVEEFMLKANEVIAKHLTDEQKEVAYRIHEPPPDDSFKDFVLLARSFGFELPDNPTQEELQTLFDKSVETPYGQHLASAFIRRMRMAIYSPTNIGHYGLSLEHYCHFTSPIRRYADLIVHRILFGDVIGSEQLQSITNHCSEQERISAKAESSVKLLKKLRLLHAIQEDEPLKEYDAVITNVKPWGMTIEIMALMMETFIHISDIGDDYFEFNERKMQLVGRHSGANYRSGEELTVTLRSVNFITLESKWDLIYEEIPEEGYHTKKRRSKRRKKSKKHKKR
ncbi:MAG: ribonuclease R [Chlamydiota bacterium]|nr:ribonuclease R [Chlamydiota bacterium]